MTQVRRCQVCGAEFLAQRSTARYCSARCRKAASRAGVGVEPRVPPQVLPAGTGDAVADMATLCVELRNVGAALVQMGDSRATPPQLRARCSRMGRAVLETMEREGL